jgi:hypothetical protein
LQARMPVFLRSARRFAICWARCEARPARLNRIRAGTAALSARVASGYSVRSLRVALELSRRR